MLTTDVTIANLALSAIGTRSKIESLTESSVEGQVISLHYENVRDELLRAAHWNFARKQINLALLADSTQLLPTIASFSSFGLGATAVAVTSATGIVVGATVTGLGIAAGTKATYVSSNVVGLSLATLSAQTSVVLTFTPNAYQAVPTPWVYEYAYPSDCVQFREILSLIPTQNINQQQTGLPNNGTVTNGFGAVNTNPVVKYLVTTDVIGGIDTLVLLTNQPAAVGVYTYRVTNPGLFDPSFVMAFAGRLAARICIALSGDKNLAKMALEEAEAIVNAAKSRDGNEAIQVQDNIPDWIKARGFRWTYLWPDGPWQATGNTQFWGGF